jgi:hypothetical protein
LTAGRVRPEEIAGGRIGHALTSTTPYVGDRHIAPAAKEDGRRRNRSATAMSALVLLDPRADLYRLPRATRVVARALQEYGAELVNTGGPLAIRAESGMGRSRTGRSADIWGPAGLKDSSLRSSPWRRVRVGEGVR